MEDYPEIDSYIINSKLIFDNKKIEECFDSKVETPPAIPQIVFKAYLLLVFTFLFLGVSVSLMKYLGA